MLLTCKPIVSLGATVDVLPPEGKISYPDAGETPIRGSFVLKGTASDDNGVQAVSVVFENIETKVRTESFQAALFDSEPGSVTWTVTVNNESTGTEAAPHELVKIYPIPDGEYTAIVTVTDKGNKTSTFTKNYKIDNTPPVFIVSRPSTITAKSDKPSKADGYGAVFSVIGQAGERNTVEKLKVSVPDAGATSIDITSMFVGNNINAQVAVYDASNPLYALQDKDKANPIKGQLYLYDNAREYNGSDASGDGNKAEWYYLRDNIYEKVLEKGYTAEVISDYFAGKKGSDKNDHDKKIKELRSDTAALAILKTAMIKMNEMRSTFKLDPSKSPGFKILGKNHVPTDNDMLPDMSKASSTLFKKDEATTLLVELIRNKDDTPLIKAYKDSNIEIVLLKWNKSGNAAQCFKENKNLIEIPLLKFSNLTESEIEQYISMEGGNLRVKCLFDPGSKDEWGEGTYAVKVKGTDITGESSNEFAAYDASNTAHGMYIINFLAIGNGPRIRPIRPQGFKNKTFDIEADVSGIDPADMTGSTGGTVYYIIKKTVSGDTGIPTEGPYPATVLTKVSLDPTDPRYKAAINIETDHTFTGEQFTDGNYTIYFLVKKNTGETDADKTDFTVDKKAPTVELNYPKPDDPQAGEITVSGSIIDGGAGVKETMTKYILGKKTPEPTVDTPSGWKAMANSTKGSWSINVNLDQVTPAEYGDVVGDYKKIPLYIFTEDEIGNKAVHTKEILFDPEGKKPIVKVLSPQNTTPTTVLGGTIQIFGTASAPKGGPSAVGEVYIQFSKNGNFDSLADGTFGTTDWYNGGNGKLIPGTGTGPGQSGADWRISINDNKEFNNPHGQKWDVYFRVRAKNVDNNSLGTWTDPIKIEVDKAAPVIGSPNLVKIDDASASNPAGSTNAKVYTPNMWVGHGKKLIGSLHDDSGIKAVQIESTGLNGGINYNLTTAQAQSWLTPVADGNYELNIPLNLNTLSQSAKDAGEFSITISITENKDNSPLTTQQTFTFRFDTKNPIGDYGSHKDMNIGDFQTDSITDISLARKVRDLGGTASSGGGCKIVTENSLLTVTKVTGSTVEFTASPAIVAGSYNYILYKPELLVYEGSSNGWLVEGVAYDRGSGIAQVKAKVVVNGVSSKEVLITETHPINRITKQLGDTVTWQGQIKLESSPSSPLAEGKGKLHYTITDKSGNTYSHSVDVRVKNNPIQVTNVTLKTQIGGEDIDTMPKTLDSLETDPVVVSSGGLNENRDDVKTFTSSNFAFKSKDGSSKIKVEWEGVQSNIKYCLKKSDGTILTDHNLQPLTSGGEITLSETNLNEIGNSGAAPAEILLELWTDETGYTQGTNSSCAKVTIKTHFDAIDTKDPSLFILPFYWNGEGKDTEQNPLNSLYEGSSENGHVEIASISSIANTYSSVSGKVSISGIAYDNIQLDKIQAVLPNRGGDVTVTAARAPGSKNWISDKTMSSDGVSLTVTTAGVDYRGHYVKWRLDWDTSKADVGTGKEITVTATDGANKTSPPASSSDPYGGTGFSTNSTPIIRGALRTARNDLFIGKKRGQFVVFKDGEKQYLTRLVRVAGNRVDLEDSVPKEAINADMYEYEANRVKIAVNIVPYITGIETPLSIGGGNEPDLYARTALGRYPVKDKEKITIKGFNLTGAECKVKGSESSTPKNLTAVSGKENEWTLELPADAKSGTLIAMVNNIKAINNENDNAKDYNKAKKTANNNKLTDDVELDVWQFNSEAALPDRGYVAEPVMRINPANGIIGFAFANGPEFFSMSKGKDSSYEKWHANTDDFGHIDFVYDSRGASHGVSAARDLNSASQQGNNFCYVTSKWGHGIPKGNDGYVGIYALRLEKLGQIGKIGSSGSSAILDKSRIQHPSLVAANGIGTDTRLYLAYYDSINDQIRFKAGTLESNMNWNYMKDGKYKKKSDGTDSNISLGAWRIRKIVGTVKYWAAFPRKLFGQFVDEAWPREIVPYNQDNVSIIAGKYMEGTVIKPTGNNTGTYLSLGVVPGATADKDVAVLIWFDAIDKKLKYTYNVNPTKEDSSIPPASNPPPGIIDNPDPAVIADLKFDTRTVPPRHAGSGSGEGYWTTAKDVFGAKNIGEYCKLVVDKDGGIHIAAYSTDTKNLHYAYLSKYDGASFTTSVVDSYGITGTQIMLDVALSANDKPIPYISYYSPSAGYAKLAYLVDKSSGFNQGAAGVKDGYFTGDWEVTCIPTTSDIVEDNINVGVWKDPSTGKITTSTTGASSSNTTSGKVYGNGTANPVLGYAITKALDGFIETAQKK